MSKSSPRTPSLNALRAFEAAARLGSFAAAADELCVTPGAVAQQIKVLEGEIGLALFVRRAQGVTLTDAAKTVLPDLRTAFDLLGQTAQALSRLAEPSVIKIAALPSIAQFWLSPRLPDLRRALPGLEISLTTMDVPPNMQRELFDLSVFFEHGTPGLGSTPIAQDEIFPVCAPEIARRLCSVEDLGGETLLSDSTWITDWVQWLDFAAPGMTIDTSGPVFSLYGLAIEEARNGAGVLVGHGPLVAQFLKSGALVAPFDLRLPLPRHITIGMAQKARADAILTKAIELLGADGAEATIDPAAPKRERPSG